MILQNTPFPATSPTGKFLIIKATSSPQCQLYVSVPLRCLPGRGGARRHAPPGGERGQAAAVPHPDPRGVRGGPRELSAGAEEAALSGGGRDGAGEPGVGWRGGNGFGGVFGEGRRQAGCRWITCDVHAYVACKRAGECWPRLFLPNVSAYSRVAFSRALAVTKAAEGRYVVLNTLVECSEVSPSDG